MSNKITCTCGHSWNKSSSSKKDMKICHICGKDNTMQMGGFVYPTNYVPQKENGGWLDKFDDGGTMQEYQENYNDSSVSMGPGFVGMGNNTKGRNYSPAWGGQFAMGGSLPGSVGFSYARTKGIPSEGPYAKKTLASAQNGHEMSFYQNGLDWTPRNISRNGSEIKKDNDGYWNPENWGKPVEIGSNEITMKGLQEMGYDNPLLGISDTGDVQMMYPGEDYKFDGESVTEYPVAQLGKTVPPLNVSDLNDPRLKAYNDSLSIYNTTSQQYKNIKKTGKLRDSDVDVDSEKKYSFKDYMDEYNRPNSDFNIFNSGTNSKMQPITVSQFRGKGILGYLDYGRQAQYKKPVQEVVLNPPSNVPKKPKPKPQPVKKKPTPQPKPVQEQPIKKTETPKPVEVKQNVYEGSPIYSNMIGDGARSALVGFANPQGDTTYIKPEDYQRYGVPAYGKEYIESKTKKKKNGGWLEKWK